MTTPSNTVTSERAEDWQPIETAPRDGAWFLAYRGPSEVGRWDRVVIVRWHDEARDFIWPDEQFDIFDGDLEERDERGYLVFDWYRSQGSFTHWRPLPSPPAPIDVGGV